jgi:hypothetical protein
MAEVDPTHLIEEAEFQQLTVCDFDVKIIETFSVNYTQQLTHQTVVGSKLRALSLQWITPTS